MLSLVNAMIWLFFFFQAEDGIRDADVTGVQTCALPIFFGSDIDTMREATEIASQAGPDLIDINYGCPVKNVACRGAGASLLQDIDKMTAMKIGRASCRERV